MFSSIFGIVASLLHIGADYFEAAQKPDVAAAARAKRLEDLKAKVQADIAAQKTAEVEKDIAE